MLKQPSSSTKQSYGMKPRELLQQLLPEPSPVRPYLHPSQYREVPNVRHYSDGMHASYTPTLSTLLLATTTLAAYISIPHVLLGLLMTAPWSPAAAASLVVLFATLLLPPKPLRVPQVLSSYIFLCWRRYFKFSYLFEVSLDSYQDYVIAQFPHGAFPIGAVLGGTFMASTYPEYPCYALAANAAFWVPLWRHVHGWLGTEACTKGNFHRLLARGVKGPLPNRHKHSQQQQEAGDGGSSSTNSSSGGLDPEPSVMPPLQQQQQQQQYSRVAGANAEGSSAFQRAATAHAAAASGGGPPDTQQQTTATAAAAAAAAAAGRMGRCITAEPRLGPFASAAAAAAAAAWPPHLSSSSCSSRPHSPITLSAAAGGSTAAAALSPMARRSSSAPLSQRITAALAHPSTIFRGAHTLSDTDSSDSSESSEESEGSEGSGSESEGGEGTRLSEGCGCGSGLTCRGPGPHTCGVTQAAAAARGQARPAAAANHSGGGAVAIIRAYTSSEDEDASSSSSSSSRRVSSSSSTGVCDCCGACEVLAEVHSLPLGSFGSLKQQQQQHSLLQGVTGGSMQDSTVLDDSAAAADRAVELDDPSCAHMPGQQQQKQQHKQQQLVLQPLPATALQQQQQQSGSPPCALKQQQQQQQQQPSLTPNNHLLRHDRSAPTNWSLDPLTGARKLGVSVALMVGGIAEMFLIRRDHERIKLLTRKGFVRIALEHGVDILPVYMFGVNQALDFGPPWLQKVSRKMRASLGVIYGVWGLPIPRCVPIFMVTGRPLPVGAPMRKDHPGFAARVDQLHAQFCVEIERLYYTHRGTYGNGFENRPLVIC